MLYLSLFCLNLLYKSLDVYNSGGGVVPNSDVYKYSDPFGRLSLRPAPGLTIAEGRHLKPREMTVHSMFGRFHCPNPKCKSKSWSSTSCNTDVRYRFDEREQRGEIVVVEEFGQQCKRCNRMVKPEFDLEATERAMSKIVERIKKGSSHLYDVHRNLTLIEP